MASIALDTPLAATLNSAVQSRIVEEGWSQEDDTALAEYIVLMLANGKTQEQVASELAGELLQDAQGTEEFSRWLFDQVNLLSNGDSGSAGQTAMEDDSAAADYTTQSGPEFADATSSIPAAYDTDMAENPPDNAPRGPKGLHSGRGGRGGRGGLMNKPADSALHRTRGNDRINSHVRGAPKGPRNLQNQNLRPGMAKALNGLTSGMPSNPMAMMTSNMQQNGQSGPSGQNGQFPPFSPEQQMQYLAMMEQQAQIMAQWNQLQQGMNSPQQPGQGRSLFDRVDSGRGRGGMRGRGRGGFQQSGAGRQQSVSTDTASKADGETQSDAGSMQVDQSQTAASNDPATTMCRFNLQCINKNCPFAHQSPAAPLNIKVDTSKACSFGPACKDYKCNAKHPSPAQIRAHQENEECRFFPNCTRPDCPFKHPTAPLCAFGASCTNPNCKFTHLSTACRFNPCTNTKCPYKHAPGQSIKTFSDYTWTPDSAKKKAEQDAKEHVSDRKFISEDAGEEELVKPEHAEGGDQNGTAEAVPAAEGTVAEDGTIT